MKNKTLKDMIKKVNWELTPELHLDDGKQWGGAVWLLRYGDVREEAIKWVKEDWKYMKEVENINPFKIVMDWMKRLDIKEEDLNKR